ncbi:extracellular solute-binding protein [Streptomyces resistomycificus]|uniref:ABC transporter substrate-binding protein n=1 Tax=Streptomyces resistomycificus TaxID=67356 RepID=A0A0L8LYG3_9ACTN|nr:extracellular solute-binding protein [Streptomyces resistomycificus]KOG43115.1 ABC transporter substrate-binding protein [Streptomyces resistomycificus]KUN97680.1 ABC transporter substrate-binding protein [Streptomyces resistomycificus]
MTLPSTVRRLAALLTVLLVTACTGSGPGGPETPAADRPGDIVVASGRDVTGKNGIRQQLIDDWNRQQEKAGTGYRARLVELPGSADEQRSQLLGALQSGSAAYDVVNLDVTWVPEFAAAGLVRRLPDGVLDGDVIKSVADTARWDDKVYAVPFNSDVGLLYYRRDHLRAVGVPQTDLSTGVDRARLQELIQSLENDPPKGYEQGWTTQLAPYEGRTVNAVEAFASATPELALTDAEGRYVATVEQLAEGIAELRRRTDPPYTLQDAVHSDEGATLADFAAGRTAFLRHWPYAYRTLHQTFTDEQLGVAPLPGRAVLGGQNLAVAAASRRADKATELIRFLTGKESERCLLDAGFAATRTSAYDSAAVKCHLTAAAPSASPTGESADRMPRDDAGRPAYAGRILLPALRSAVQRPRTPLYGAFTQTFTAQLGALFGDRPPSDAELARRLDKALRKALPD